MSTPDADAATQKVLAGIEDPAIDARYPNRTHFIAVDNPRHGQMTTKVLFEGDPVVLVYPDGREVLFTPEQAVGIAGLLILLAALWLRLRSRKEDGDVVQLPPRTRVEARDSAGMSVAA
jgi:hypothetical protein